MPDTTDKKNELKISTSSNNGGASHRHTQSLPSPTAIMGMLNGGGGPLTNKSNSSDNTNAATTGISPTERFHRRSASAMAVPKPSHKPPSTFHSFRGDIQSQDVFVEEIKKRCKSSKLRILFPGADRFEMQRMDVWNHDNICTPCLILQPKDNREVAACLRGYVAGVNKCLAANKQHGAKFALAIPRLAVAGGRNSIHCMKDGSIVLDLSKMRSVKVDPTNQTCKVQGGAKIIDVDSALEEYGLISVLGTSQHLGVVGCILGGGVGFASRKHGLACDNVLSADVIQADGRIYQCDFTKHRDLLWAICGGGGGLGVIVSITLKCYKLRHAALLTCDLPVLKLTERRRAIRNWSNWVLNDVDNDELKPGNEEYIVPLDAPVPNEVYSQMILPTDGSSVKFMASSIDVGAIDQTDGFLEAFESAQRKTKKRAAFSFLMNKNKGAKKASSGSGKEKKKVLGWSDIPGLNHLVHDHFHTTRSHVNFSMVRYWDQLQSHSNDYFTPGNIFSATKYCKSLSNRIVEVLVHATCKDISPKNESKIVIMAMGGEISGDGQNATQQHQRAHSSFSARDSKYMIYIEGKWDALAGRKIEKEKKNVVKWVNWVVNQLHRCDGVQSSAHPESTRDQVSKSGKSLPPPGYYNFDKECGKRLAYIKRRKDPKNIFSLASRVSWPKVLSTSSLGNSANGGGVDDSADDSNSIVTELSKADNVKNGEIDPTQCFSPQKDRDVDLGGDGDGDGNVDEDEGANDVLLTKGSAHSVDSMEATELDNNDESEHGEISSGPTPSVDGDETVASVASDIKRLLSMTESDDALKDWALAPVALTEADFDGGSSEDEEGYSPTSIADLKEDSIAV